MAIADMLWDASEFIPMVDRMGLLDNGYLKSGRSKYLLNIEKFLS